MSDAKREVLEKVVALSAPLGPVAGRALFGGFGVFCDGLMFALITRQGELYLKADDENRPAFETAALAKFGCMPY